MRPGDRVRIAALAAPQELRNWSWIAPDGKEVRGAEPELVSELKKGALPPTTLVWQKTWLEWMPARDVAELASAFPKQRSHPPVEPKRSPTALTPPARPEAPKLPKNPVALPPAGASPAQKGAAPSSFGTIGRPRGPSVLGPARGEGVNTAPPRAPLATLGDEPLEQRATLRPPGAIPPPPRQVPSPNFDLTPSRLKEELEAPTRRQNPLPGVTVKDITPGPRPPASALPSELAPAVILPAKSVALEPRAAKPAPLAKPVDIDLDATLGSTPFEVTAQDFVDLPPPSTTLESTGAAGTESKTEPPLRKRAKSQAKKPTLFGMVVLASLVGLGTFVAVKLLTRTKTSGTSAPAKLSVTNSPPPTTPAPGGCGIVQPAARLAASVHRPVLPLVAAAQDATRASVGFAENEHDAVGLVVDLVTLDAQRVFRESKKAPLRYVVPLALDSTRFVVDRDDGSTMAARSVDAEPRFSIGPSEKDWVRHQGRATGVVWAGQAAEKTTDPHVASSASGHLVTFRRGGLSGQVLYGFLGPDGSAKGELLAVEAPNVRLSGTPDGALSGDTWLVAFAGRGTPEEEWHIVLASGKLGGGAPSVRVFATPPGGAGGSSIAPSVSGLGDGGFVLQWTEGKTAEYQVRVQRLGPDLEPQGEGVLVSPKGANAGQGAVFARSPRALSLFVQTTQGHDELWGTSLECP
jgi:hypothetical protein